MARHKKKAAEPERRSRRGAPKPFPANGRWAVDVELPKTPGGTRRRVRVYGDTAAEAERAMRGVLDARDAGETAQAAADTLRGYAEWFLDTVKAPRVTKQTLENYRGWLTRHVYPRLGNRPLAKVSTEQIQTMLAVVGTKHPATARDIDGLLRQLYHYAGRAKPAKVKENPMLGVDRPQYRPRPPRPMNAREFAAFTKAIVGHPYEGALWLSLSSLRVAEVCGAQWSDIDWEAGAIRVRRQTVHTKGSLALTETLKTPTSRRTVYLAPQALAALRAQHARDAAEQLRTGRRSAQIVTPVRATLLHPSSFWRAFKAALQLAGLDPKAFHLHDLRHTWATLAHEAGVPLADAQAQMGHSDPAMTRHYSHPTEDGQKAAAARVGRLLDERSG